LAIRDTVLSDMVYVSESSAETNTGKNIGNGLFAKKDLKKDTFLGYFIGEIRSHEEIMEAELFNSGYLVMLSSKLYLDCSKSYKSGDCTMSNINSFKDVIFKNSNSKDLPVANCRISIHHTKYDHRASVKLTQDVLANEELFLDYDPVSVIQSNLYGHTSVQIELNDDSIDVTETTCNEWCFVSLTSNYFRDFMHSNQDNLQTELVIKLDETQFISQFYDHKRKGRFFELTLNSFFQHVLH
jgi:hypothetical protein